MSKAGAKLASNILKSVIATLLYVAVQQALYAQVKIIDQQPLQPIQHAELVLDGVSAQVYSNADGLMEISLGATVNRFSIFALGYETVSFEADALDTLQYIYLTPIAYNLRGVDIIDSVRIPIKVSAGAITVDAQMLEKLPTLFGEPDLLKNMQLLPGVSSVMENNVGLYVRGGKAENSMISIDGATIYNPSHSAGFFSVVHPASVRSATLVKDGIAAEYGGRSSAFLDVGLKEGNYKQFASSVSIGFISSYLDVQGPLSKGKHPTSMQFVARSTYIDKVVSLVSSSEPNFKTGFHDYSLKISSLLAPNKKLSAAFYHSNDHFKFDVFQFLNFGSQSTWNNDIFSLKYANSTNKKWLQTTSFSFSNYRLDNSFTGSQLNSGIKDIGLKHHYQSYSNHQLVQSVGLQATYHQLQPGNMQVTDTAYYIYDAYTISNQSFIELAPYINLKKEWAHDIELKVGFRLSNYLSSNLSTCIPEPRLQLIKHLGKNSLFVSYDKLSQFLHQYSANVTPMPADAWFSSSAKAKPTISNSLTLGYLKSSIDQTYNFSASLFYRIQRHTTDIKSGSTTFIPPNYNKWIAVGNNKSYGAEFLIQKLKGSLTGWVAYTYCRSINLIPGIVSGNSYYANHDKPHILNVALNKSLGNWEINTVFVFQSGRPITMPLYTMGIITQNSERNAYRLPAYHRLDVSLTHYQKKRKHRQGSWNISIYNLYNRQNVYNIQYNPLYGKVRYLTLFPIIPSFSYKASIF